MTCAVIGNGTSALDRELGEVIDDHDAVVRFNAFVTDGFEKQVGGKTTFWFNVMERRFCGPRLCGDYQHIYLHNWTSSEDEDPVLRSFRAEPPPSPFSKVHHGHIEELRAFAGEPSYSAWSTGAIAIWLMLNDFDTVSLAGFDWWEARSKHHYSDNGVLGKLHQPAAEKRFIDLLCVNGRVRFL